jgi:hypothetical protein
MRLRQAHGESDYAFAIRRLKLTAALLGASIVACLLWWPAFPFVDGHGPLVLLLTGMVTALLALTTAALLFVLVAALLSWGWLRLEFVLPAMQTIRLRLSAAWNRYLPLFMMLGSGGILAHSGLVGEIPTLERGPGRDVSFVQEPVHAGILWLLWLAIFVVGFIWFLARLGAEREKHDG